MRKSLLICSVLVALALIPAIMTVQAPSIEFWKWVTPAYDATDTYFGTTVVAYERGTAATLMVKVYNDLASSFPYKVRVFMDWATTNTSTDDQSIPSKQWYTFQVSIPIPDSASNLALHSYRIYIEYIDVTVKWVYYGGNPYIGGSNFAVYSADQADFQQLKKEYNQWRNSYMGGGGITALLGMTANARKLWTNASLESYLGDESYRMGSFSDAKTHYGIALNSTKDAITSDIDKTASLEDAFIGIVDAGKTYLSMQGYGFMIISIGFLLMGVGVLVYLVRRSKPPVTP